MDVKLFSSARGSGFLQGTLAQFKRAARKSFPGCTFVEVEDGAINVHHHGDLVREYYIYEAVIQEIGEGLPHEEE